MPRAARIATLVGLTLAALAVAIFTTWAIYVRATWEFKPGFLAPDRAAQGYFGRGLRILTQHDHFMLGAIAAIACVVVAALLVVLIRRGTRWPYLVTTIGSLAAIAPAWLVRSQVWHAELAMSRNAKWAARSPYVARATTIAAAITIFLSLLAIASFVAWLTSRKQPA